MQKMIWVLLTAVMMVGCHPRASYQIESLSPSARQQMYTYEVGSQRGLICNTVDATPLPYYTYEDLPADGAEVGYLSSDNTGDVRRRCRRDRNSEFHAWLVFDLGPVLSSPPPGTLDRVTLSGEEHGLADNSACNLTRDSLLELVVTGYAPLLELDTSTPPRAVEVGELDIDETIYSFREYTHLIGEDNTQARVGTDPNFVYTWSEDSLRSLQERFDRGGPSAADEYDVTLIGADNPDMTGDRRCLARLSNLRLNLIFRSE